MQAPQLSASKPAAFIHAAYGPQYIVCADNMDMLIWTNYNDKAEGTCVCDTHAN